MLEVPWTGDWTEEHRRFYQRVEELIVQAAADEARTFSTQLATRAMELMAAKVLALMAAPPPSGQIIFLSH